MFQIRFSYDFHRRFSGSAFRISPSFKRGSFPSIKVSILSLSDQRESMGNGESSIVTHESLPIKESHSIGRAPPVRIERDLVPISVIASVPSLPLFFPSVRRGWDIISEREGEIVQERERESEREEEWNSLDEAPVGDGRGCKDGSIVMTTGRQNY